MKNSALLFLIRKSSGVTDVCLAMRKQGDRKGRYNGIDATVVEGETPESALRTAAEKEVSVTVDTMVKRAEISFMFPHEPSSNQLFHIYTSDDFTGEPIESEDMNPAWLSTTYIPYSEMWQDVIFWLPQILDGKKVKGKFVFGVGDVITEKEVTIVETV
jgi:hypothetical protein